jgi:hypothetical protein
MLKKVLTDGKENMLQVLRSKLPPGSNYINGNKFLTASALQFDNSKFPPFPPPAAKVSLWDPTTGMCSLYLNCFLINF